MKIKNFGELATNPLRTSALKIVEAGLLSIDTVEVLRENISVFGDALTISNETIILPEKSRIFVVGVGKCATDAAFVLEEILGDRIYKGMVIDIKCDPRLKRIKSAECDHPFPSERNVDATKEMIDVLKEAKEDDVVIAVISGGGSTMLCQPKGFTCYDEKTVVDALFRAGANIKELNTVRKHMSMARGGHLAGYAYPAKVVSLIFSDVVGNDLGFIASGPTVLDETSVEDAKHIFDKYFLKDRVPITSDVLMETPKDWKYFENVKNILLVSNDIGLEAMYKSAKREGFVPTIVNKDMIGEAAIIGESIAIELNKAPAHSALLFGGETVVRIKGNGHGGRNQEMALSALRFIGESEIIVPFASDGRDNTDVAGAICDTIIKSQATKKKVSIEKFLSNNDSYSFFEKVGGHLMTGVTGSNTADFVVALKH